MCECDLNIYTSGTIKKAGVCAIEEPVPIPSKQLVATSC